MMKSFKYFLPLSNNSLIVWNAFSFGKKNLLLELGAPLFALSDHFHMNFGRLFVNMISILKVTLRE